MPYKTKLTQTQRDEIAALAIQREGKRRKYTLLYIASLYGISASMVLKIEKKTGVKTLSQIRKEQYYAQRT